MRLAQLVVAATLLLPIVPSLAVFAGIGWDGLAKSNQSVIRLIAGTMLVLFIIYQLALVGAIMPAFADRFGASRHDGIVLERAIGGDSAPAYCFGLDTNQLFYVRRPLQCLDAEGQKSVSAPAWLFIPRSTVTAFARLRPDLDLRVAVETASGPQLAAVHVDKRPGGK